MITVMFKLPDGPPTTVVVADHDDLLELCHVLEDAHVVQSYTISEPQRVIHTVEVYGWRDHSFPKFKYELEF
ncbi:hypothetical protein ST201phi2-1p087 [Pseudomonas phage 201phi2-1]|uniref:Uncharacterized protein n=1 Tax=Pseudomonas phage 201phi2-1 TaxID=198110 RepID=B3FK62_BP201|nr:hypothetical protein ST201phi2-1p087 [Pseudomonas phage 201phi2-1]ABY62920.1 hypothetical protein 201phi2-1p087 [Pseudomonas phage 201phi2-1]